MYLPDLIMRFWQACGSAIPFSDLTDEHSRPFYDAAWELARIGVMRPGRVAPKVDHGVWISVAGERIEAPKPGHANFRKRKGIA